jgi:hypothetical protein
MAAHNVLAEMGRLNLIPRGSAEWKSQRTTILSHLANDGHNGHVFIEDIHNNIGRYCSLRGDQATGRSWRVQAAVKGGQYVVRHATTGEHRVVSSSAMSSLY